jgi:hypothetical protein
MMTVKQPYTCYDYRREMVLVCLRNRMNDPALSEDEKQSILREIHRLEKELGLE